MKPPPRLAGWMVRLACPSPDLPYVLGDLDAEFQLRGGPVLWYWRQALTSVWALTLMGLRRWEWECALLAIFLSSATPILFMDAWWRYLLCHVPLKADLARGGDFAVISLVYSAVVSICAGAVCTVRGLRLAIPLACTFALLGEASTHSIFPVWFSAVSLVTVAISLAGGAWARHKLDRPPTSTCSPRYRTVPHGSIPIAATSSRVPLLASCRL